MKSEKQFLFINLMLANSLLGPLQAVGEEQEELLTIYGSKEMISLATGYEQTVSEAPATATVITAEEIQRLGARTLDEVLRTVPGLHITTPRALTAAPVIRGIVTETGGNLLVMINGIRLESAFTGGGSTFKDILVESIERVEVIRGPGSALYGADAFAGVINIITKTAKDIDGMVIGGRVGSFETYDGWALYGGHWGAVDVALMALGRTTNGDNQQIDADAQSFLDQQFGTDASLAPGPVNTDLSNGELRLDLAWQALTMRANYEYKKQGTGTGYVNALDPEGEFKNERFEVDLEYHDEMSDTLELKAVASLRQQTQNPQLVFLPPGTRGFEPDGTPTTFLDGVQTDVKLTERQILGETSAIFSGISKHKLRLGVGAYVEEIDDVEDQRNFLIGPGGILIPTGIVTDTESLGVSVAQPENDRTVVYGFAQDEWRFLQDWTLTTGVRIDSFSDVGTSLNPRVALIWNADINSTIKLLAGRAFRAPAFIEAYSQNNLIAEGNPDLDPEKLTNVEFSFDHRWLEGYITLTTYWFEIDERIQIQSDPQAAPVFLRFDNAGEQNGYGMEVSAGKDLQPNFSISGHYAFQDTQDQDTGQDAGIAPRHKLYAEINWEPQTNWHINLNVLAVFDCARQPGDPRDDIDDYAWVNVVMQRENIHKHIDVGIGISNLLDDNAHEPSTSATTLPDDIPLEGRSIFGEVVLRF